MYTVTIRTAMKPGSTIEAMLRFFNSLTMTKEELQELVEHFNQLNPHARPPRPYQEVEIPVLGKYAK